MSDKLTKEKLNALLDSIDKSSKDKGKADDMPRVRPYVAGSTAKSFNRVQLRGLRTIHECLAWKMSTMLTESLGMACHIEFENIMERPVRNLGNYTKPVPIVQIVCDALDGPMLMEIDPKIVHVLVDRTLGGPGELPKEVKTCSETEAGVLQLVFREMDSCLQQAWLPVTDLMISDLHILPAVRLNHLYNPYESLLTMAFKLELSRIQSYIYIHMAGSALMPVRSTLVKGSLSSSPMMDVESDNDGKVRMHVREAKVDVKGMLTGATLNVKDIMGLQMGDVIQLEHKLTDEVEVHVEDYPYCMGNFGMFKGIKSVKVTRTMNKMQNDEEDVMIENIEVNHDESGI